MDILSMLNVSNCNSTFFDSSIDKVRYIWNEHNSHSIYQEWESKTLYGLCLTTSLILSHWFYNNIINSPKSSKSKDEWNIPKIVSFINSSAASKALLKNLGSQQRPPSHQLRRRLTSIGRFAARSETNNNPSVITFFVGLANRRGTCELSVKEFEDLWKSRVMKRHERFRSCISADNDRFFQYTTNEINDYIKEVTHPTTHHTKFQKHLEKLVAKRINVYENLWDAQICTGKLGSSGAIPAEVMPQIDNDEVYDKETIAVFRVHHSVGDGVSMSVALGDVSDEADELHEAIEEQVRKRKMNHAKKTFLQKLNLFVKMCFFYVVGGVVALSLQFYRMATCANPFDRIMERSETPEGERSVTWKHISSVDDMKCVAKSIGKHVTINDVMVSCVTRAIARQLKQHHDKKVEDRGNFRSTLPDTVNVCIPVHLTGGVILPGQSIGNKVGAFVTKVPACCGTTDNGISPSRRRLLKVSAALKEGKRTPAPLIAYSLAKLFSDVTPKPMAQFALRHGNANSVAVISNVHGFPFRVHWNNRPVLFLSAFLPLPPGIPIGIVVQSYDGNMSFTVNADKRAVPDADCFAGWVMEEYERLRKEAGI